MKKFPGLEVIMLMLTIVFLASSVVRYLGHSPHWIFMLTAACAALLIYVWPKEVLLALFLLAAIALTTVYFSDTFMEGATLILDTVHADFSAWQSIYEFPGPLATLVMSVAAVFMLTYLQLFLAAKGFANSLLILLGFAVYLGLWFQHYPGAEKELLIFFAFAFPTLTLFYLRTKRSAVNASYKLAVFALGALSAVVVTFLPYQKPLYYEEVFLFANTHIANLQTFQRAEAESGQGFASATAQVSYSSSGELGGSISNGTQAVMQLALMEGSFPRAIYLRGRASNHYTGRSWDSDPGSGHDLASAFRHVEVYENEVTLGVTYLQWEEDIFGLFPTTAIEFSGNDYNREYEADALGNMRFASGTFEGAYLLSGKVISNVNLRNRDPQADLNKELPHLLPYLQLPNHLPQRVKDLAAEITAGARSDLEKTEKVNDFLRQFPYNIATPPHPPGEDFVDYFLFELQEGYCTYYASAMAILLRVENIPTRYVVGYRVPADHYLELHTEVTGLPPIIMVQQNHAHAWVEVFLDGYGWVAYEPTQPFEILGSLTDDSSPAIQDEEMENEFTEAEAAREEPAGEAEVGGETEPAAEATEAAEETNGEEGSAAYGEPGGDAAAEINAAASNGERTLPRGTWIFAFAGAFFFSTSFAFYHGLTHSKDPVALYQKVVKLKSGFHLPPGPAETPSQIVAQLQQSLPQLEEDLELMKHYYHMSFYSRGAGSAGQLHNINGLGTLPWKTLLLYRKKLGLLHFSRGILKVLKQWKFIS